MIRMAILFMIIGSWGFLFPTANAQTPIIAGHVFEQKSEVLSATRRYMVDLPENYYDNELDYPTLYVIDADFQFQHVSAIAKNLARMGKVPPMIVVGVANQGNDDYVYQTTWKVEGESAFGGAKYFYQYITSELVTHIDKTYRTSENRILAGYSLGGLFSTYAMMQKDTPFNAFLAMSPSFWVDDYAAKSLLVDAVKLAQKEQRIAPLYLSVANEEGMGVKEVADALTTLNVKNWQFKFQQFPNENHFSTALPAFSNALEFLFPNYYLDSYELMAHKDVFDVLNTFSEKKAGYNGFRVSWLQAYKLSKYMFHSKQLNKVPELLSQIKSNFPDSIVNVTNYLAVGFNKTKQHDKALEVLTDIRKAATHSALWHHQYSLALNGLGKLDEASKYQKIAMQLAKQQSLPMWQVWEMK